MATWKKTNEAWFGDTFNRDVMLCSGEIAYDTARDSDCTAIKTINWNDNSVANLACNEAVINKDTLDQICGNAYAITTVDPLRDRFEELQAQINELKEKLKTKKENSELRSALKTLHYKREVE